MTYPSRHLLEDETIIDERGLHFVKLVPNIFGVLTVFAGLAAGFVLWKSAPSWFGIGLGAVFLATLVYTFAKLLIFRSTQVVLTTNRLICRSGIFKRTTRDIPLGSIIDLGSHQTLIKRVVGLGDVEVRINAQSEPVILRDLSHPKQLVALVHGATEALERSRVSAVIAESQPPDVDKEYRRLISLHRKGVITQRELEDHTRRLGIEPQADEEGRTDT